MKIQQVVTNYINKVTDPLIAKLEQLELKHAVYETHFTNVEKRIDDAGQYSRSVCVRIYGIPLAKGAVIKCGTEGGRKGFKFLF